MCCNTKEKIADALRQQLMTKPFDKITVQNLMDATSMKRQSFYYHFQDTRDVLTWICSRELAEPLEQSELPLVEWMLYAMQLLDNNRGFYRRIVNGVEPEFVHTFAGRQIRPKMALQLYGTSCFQSLEPEQAFVVEFTTLAVSSWLIQFVRSRAPLDLKDAHRKLKCLLATLHMEQPPRSQSRVG